MKCPDCGAIDYAELDGYDFAERMLEGVVFRVEERDGALAVSLDADQTTGLLAIRMDVAAVLRDALEHVQRSGELTCPKCKEPFDAKE